jgi:hypothetical protein
VCWHVEKFELRVKSDIIPQYKFCYPKCQLISLFPYITPFIAHAYKGLFQTRIDNMEIVYVYCVLPALTLRPMSWIYVVHYFSKKLKRTLLYRVSREECKKLWKIVSYVKIYRYNPKHLYPKLNVYGDNGQRSLKLWQLLQTYWLPNSY